MFFSFKTFENIVSLHGPKLKQPKCPSTVEQVNQLWYAHTMEYYSTAVLTGDDVASQETFGNVWRYFLVTRTCWGGEKIATGI